MSKVSANQIMKLLNPRLEQLGLSQSDVDVSTSLLEQGILDSMSFLEFIIELESTFDIELDFSEMDPSEFTSIDNITNLVSNGSSN